MKKYIILALSLCAPLHCMELQQPKASYIPVSDPQEWPAEEYARGNKNQIACFSALLDKHAIETKNKTILSIGCGTGEIEAKLAQNATYVHGIDASNNQIKYAQEHYSTANLSFAPCFAENFETIDQYELAIMSCCFHLFKNKPQALQRISDSLEPHGLLFTNIETANHPTPFSKTVLKEMMDDITLVGSLLSALPDPIGSTRPTLEELYTMFDDAGFVIVKKQEESFNWTMSEQEWRQMQLPLILCSPGAQTLINLTSPDQYIKNKLSEGVFSLIQQNMTKAEQEQHDQPFFPESSNELVCKVRDNNFCRYLFNNFLNRILTKLHKNEDGTYSWRYCTTAILATKK